MGLNLGSSGFSRNQNYRGLSGAHVICMYGNLSVKTNKRKTSYSARRSWKRLFLHLFLHVWSAKNLKTPNWAPWLRMPLGGMGGLGSLVYVCDFVTECSEDRQYYVDTVQFQIIVLLSQWFITSCNVIFSLHRFKTAAPKTEIEHGHVLCPISKLSTYFWK